MCGLVAVLGDGDPTGKMFRALAEVAHRGVRQSHVWAKGCAVGHTRLPIVGLDIANDQPVVSGRWTIAFVGELLDFKDFVPDAACDIELVKQTWLYEGATGFRRFDGFWSVVAYDEDARELHLLTDYLAQKPLYYRADQYAVAAASEPAALAVLGPTTPDLIYFSAVCKWGYCPDGWRTPYREVRKLHPGEHLVLNKHGVVRSEIVDELYPTPGSPASLKAAIEEAVRLRVTSSDVPVAALVSGGLDSAITYTLACRHGDVDALHVHNDEFNAARKVIAGAQDVDLEAFARFQFVDRNEMEGVSDRLALMYMQEPLDLGSLRPQVALSDALGRRGVNVCLTGDGADELFGGYGRAARYDSQASDVWHELVSWHLPRLDRVMMRNRVEVRSPFLARDVACMALALPREQRTGKKILRDLFRDDLPPSVADVPKKALRTKNVEEDREARSVALVELFKEMTWS